MRAEQAAAALCPTSPMSENLCYKWKRELATAYFGTSYVHHLRVCLLIANTHEE